MDNYDVNNYDVSNQQPEQRPKKKGGFLRFIKYMAIAVCFGFVAGGVMFGVNWAAGELVNSSNNTNGSNGAAQKEIASVNAGSQNEIKNVDTTNKIQSASSTIVTDVSAVVEEVMPSIVAITSTQIVDPGYSFWFSRGETYEQQGAGSGIIVGKSDTELLIVTNNHVVADSDSLSVQFINKTSIDAYIKGTNSKNDLAVISIPLDKIDADTMNSIKIANLGNSDELKVGEGAIAIGNALGYGQSVTTGVISALDREVTVENNTLTLLQTDTAINPGNSGGALINIKGEVIGINAAKYSSDSVEGMGFAIPISSAKEIISNLMSKQTRMKVDEEERGYLGIDATDVDDMTSRRYGIPQGVYVYSTSENGAAERAGLDKGYVITALDGEEVLSVSELEELLEYYAKGEKVTLTVQIPEGNSYREDQVEVTLGERIEDSSRRP